MVSASRFLKVLATAALLLGVVWGCVGSSGAPLAAQAGDAGPDGASEVSQRPVPDECAQILEEYSRQLDRAERCTPGLESCSVSIPDAPTHSFSAVVVSSEYPAVLEALEGLKDRFSKLDCEPGVDKNMWDCSCGGMGVRRAECGLADDGSHRCVATERFCLCCK